MTPTKAILVLTEIQASHEIKAKNYRDGTAARHAEIAEALAFALRNIREGAE